MFTIKKTGNANDPFGRMGPTVGLSSTDKYKEHWTGTYYSGKLVPGSEVSMATKVGVGAAGILAGGLVKWTEIDIFFVMTEDDSLVITEPKSMGMPKEVYRFQLEPKANRPEIKYASEVVEMPEGESDTREAGTISNNLHSASRLLAITPKSNGTPDERNRILLWSETAKAAELISWSNK